MNWDDLRFLVVIGREGTLAAASRRLKVDQTTVARRLRALERTLGATLFERDAGRWLPTAVGRGVLERAARIEEDVVSVVRAAEAGADTVSGVVRITSVSAIISGYLTARLPELYARHPELVVALLASNENLNVSRREADIAIRLARPPAGDFLIRKLAECGFATYGPAREDVHARPGDWVAYLEDLAHTPEMRWLDSQLRGGRIRLRSNSLGVLAQAVANGIGCGILPCFIADRHPGLERLDPAQPAVTRDLWLLTHREARRQARVAAAADWLVERFEADAAGFRGRRAPRS
ncbi:MAG: LysR family transcriptional regulator [Gammaproteobacteria bacterium]|nr:LysR family transcriptional regulator [Gammaproteobacteria bacterium]